MVLSVFEAWPLRKISLVFSTPTSAQVQELLYNTQMLPNSQSLSLMSDVFKGLKFLRAVSWISSHATCHTALLYSISQHHVGVLTTGLRTSVLNHHLWPTRSVWRCVCICRETLSSACSFYLIFCRALVSELQPVWQSCVAPGKTVHRFLLWQIQIKILCQSNWYWVCVCLLF